MSVGKGKGNVLKICSKFTGENPCWSVISIKLQSHFIEIAPRHGCSPVNLLHVFRTPFPKNTSWRRRLINFFENIFSKFHEGSRKVYSAQHCLLAPHDKWRQNIDDGELLSALLTDLLKACDWLPHDLLAANLFAYRFGNRWTRFLLNYLKNH